MAEKNPVVKVVKKTLPAVVSITSTTHLEVFKKAYNPLKEEATRPNNFQGVKKLKKKIKIGGGSGFIVEKNGIILTNRHVVEDTEAEYIVILQSGEKIKPKILSRDPINDVAVLKIEKDSLPYIKLGDSSNLELGESVIAIGNALGIFQNTVSVGVISGLSRTITAESAFTLEATRLRGLIQTDAAINPGNSGGPLINMEGEAIGINAAVIVEAENIGFALPINNAKKDLEDIKKYGRVRQPFLGIRYILITKELNKKFGLGIDFGALVISEPDVSGILKPAVIPESPAEKAGIQEGDIILEFNGQKITETNPLNDALRGAEIGKEAPIKILRNGKTELMLKITPVERY
jgi:S1-C subfamily serine protease